MTIETPSSSTLSPLTPAQKKARRQHAKTTKNRPADIKEGWTPFRAAEKRFKAKWPAPDMSGVLDLHDDGIAGESTGRSSWRGSRDVVEWTQANVSVDEKGEGKAFIFPRVPGMQDCFVLSMYILITCILCKTMIRYQIRSRVPAWICASRGTTPPRPVESEGPC